VFFLCFFHLGGQFLFRASLTANTHSSGVRGIVPQHHWVELSAMQRASRNPRICLRLLTSLRFRHWASRLRMDTALNFSVFIRLVNPTPVISCADCAQVSLWVFSA
jgi:hypothetical protein